MATAKRRGAAGRGWASGRSGSSMVLVLGAVIIIMSLAILALVSSMANIKLSAKFRNWNRDYYELSGEAVLSLETIDRILSEAEGLAGYYVNNAMYAEDRFGGFGEGKKDHAIGGFMWAEGIGHAAIHGEWARSVYAPSFKDVGGGVTLFDGLEYESRLKSFLPDVFDRLYAFFAYGMLSDYDSYRNGLDGNGLSLRVSQAMSEYLNVSKWDGRIGEPADFSGLTILISVEGTLRDGKRMDLEVSLNPTEVEILSATMMETAKGNPIWSYALSASGGIRAVGGEPTFHGDVYASGEEGFTVEDAYPEIYGNVYSAGALTVVGGGGIGVSFYGRETSTDIKSDMYCVIDEDGVGYVNKHLFMDLTGIFPNDPETVLFVRSLASADNDNWYDLSSEWFDGGLIPYVFVDGKITVTDGRYGIHWGDEQPGGGNVYAGGIKVEGGDGANVRIEGNVLTSGDIAISGHGSSIVIDGIVVGIGEGSSITNGNPYGEDGSIDSAVILTEGVLSMPGTVTAVFPEFYGDAYFRGHVGEAVVQGEDGFGEVMEENRLDEQINESVYRQIIDCLRAIFVAKTRSMGTLAEPADMRGMVDMAFIEGRLAEGRAIEGVMFLSAGPDGEAATLEIKGEMAGIVLCDGDLAITGDGTLRGAVIVLGDVVVSGNFTICYDEGVISSALREGGASDAFRPGQIEGGEGIYIKMGLAGGVRVGRGQRFTILSQT